MAERQAENRKRQQNYRLHLSEMKSEMKTSSNTIQQRIFHNNQKHSFDEFSSWFSGKSVAIVGNSKALFSSKSGTTIDSFDLVCRINRAFYCLPPITQQYQLAIGKRMDFLFLNRAAICGNKKFNSTRIIQTTASSSSYPYVDYIVEKTIMINFNENFSKKPSTGLRVLHLLSLTNAAKIGVFGFDFKKLAPSFYGNGDDWTQSQHDYTEEQHYFDSVLLNRMEMY